MNGAFKYVVAMLACLLVFVSAKAQTSLEEELKIYENACRMCLSLKTRIDAGEVVSRDEAKATIDLFVAMNRKLKAIENEMTVLQRQRFKDVGEWFTTGMRPVRPSALPSVVCKAMPALPVHSSENLLVVPDPLPSEPVGREHNIPSPSYRYIILAEIAAPELAYGGRVGIMNRRFGGYAAFRSNFAGGAALYGCTSDGRLPNGGKIWANGEERTENMTVTAGFLAAARRWMTAYAGAGYGWRYLQWQDIDGNWAEVSDYSHRGVALEAGLVFSYRKSAFSIGLSTISFKTAAFTMGVGLQF